MTWHGVRTRAVERVLELPRETRASENAISSITQRRLTVPATIEHYKLTDHSPDWHLTRDRWSGCDAGERFDRYE